jgi:hypothetical protein
MRRQYEENVKEYTFNWSLKPRSALIAWKEMERGCTVLSETAENKTILCLSWQKMSGAQWDLCFVTTDNWCVIVLSPPPTLMWCEFLKNLNDDIWKKRSLMAVGGIHIAFLHGCFIPRDRESHLTSQNASLFHNQSCYNWGYWKTRQ